MTALLLTMLVTAAGLRLLSPSQQLAGAQLEGWPNKEKRCGRPYRNSRKAVASCSLVIGHRLPVHHVFLLICRAVP